MEEKQMQQAKAVFATICNSLDKMGWNYDKKEENFLVVGSVRGEDLPLEFRIRVDPERQLVSLLSQLLFFMAEDKRVEGAIATGMINYSLVDGSFDYNIDDGALIFRLTSSFRESLLGEELFNYMIGVSLSTVDEYNDKLLMLSKGMIDIKQFAEHC